MARKEEGEYEEGYLGVDVQKTKKYFWNHQRPWQEKVKIQNGTRVSYTHLLMNSIGGSNYWEARHKSSEAKGHFRT